MMSRKRIYAMLTYEDEDDKVAIWYNRIMVVVIVLCMVPLWFKQTSIGFVILDRVCVSVFIFDYALRWITADFKLKRGKASFALYPVTPMAILDLLSILPSFVALSNSLKAIRILRVLRALRAFKLVRYSKSMRILVAALHNQRQPLLVILVLAVVYVTVCATIMFNVEPDMFGNFIDALYWAVISLTTIGYGDLAPATEAGRIIAMVSALAGVAVIALPSGVITAGLIEELGKRGPREPWDRWSHWDYSGQADQASQPVQPDQPDQPVQPDQPDQDDQTE